MNRSPAVRSRTAVLTLTACLGITLGAAGLTLPATAADPAAPSSSTDEVATWGASADRTGATMTDQTVRNIVHTSVGGDDLRVSLSNVFGSKAVTFDKVFVGERAQGANLVPGSNEPVTFSRQPSVTVPAGAEVLSDPIAGIVPAQSDLAVSIHVVGAAGTVTGHNLATQTSYVSTAGDQAADEAGTAYTRTMSNWYWVDALVVDAPKQVDTVATLGDSITDGYGSTPNANHRWPDYLAQRMLQVSRPHQFGVMNEGISGNKVLSDGAGVSALARLDRDVLAQPDVHTAILLEGINDISGGATADQIIAGYRQLIARAHSEGTCLIGGTLTAFETAGPQREAQRTAVNEFIRNSGEFDGVVDFDAATRDPNNLDAMLPAYDSGDHLHPSDAGYEAMAAAVDLGALDCQR